jgi:glucose-1-phosphate cytidylyltransferase
MEFHERKVVILCGGKGTRFREQTENLPKPLISIGDKPMLLHIMECYHSAGFKKFVLCLGYKGSLISDYFVKNFGAVKNEKPDTVTLSNDWEVTLANTGENTLTAKRLYLVKEHLRNDDSFLLTYGDGLANVNLKKLADFHVNQNVTATITAVYPQSRFGVIDISDKNLVLRFREKPRSKELINGGFMVFNNNIFNHPLLSENIPLEEVLRSLANDHQLAAHTHEGFWYCMDTQKDHDELNAMWCSSEGHPPWTWN